MDPKLVRVRGVCPKCRSVSFPYDMLEGDKTPLFLCEACNCGMEIEIRRSPTHPDSQRGLRMVCDAEESKRKAVNDIKYPLLKDDDLIDAMRAAYEGFTGGTPPEFIQKAHRFLDKHADEHERLILEKRTQPEDYFEQEYPMPAEEFFTSTADAARSARLRAEDEWRRSRYAEYAIEEHRKAIEAVRPKFSCIYCDEPNDETMGVVEDEVPIYTSDAHARCALKASRLQAPEPEPLRVQVQHEDYV